MWHPGIPEEWRNQIVTGDARELAKRIPDGSVGMVLTSPPYNVGLDYVGYDDNLPEDRFVEFNRDWMSEAYRVCAEGARAYIIVSDKMKWWFKPLAESIGWTWAQELTWCKPNIVNHARISGDWNYMVEPILMFRKGKRTPMLDEVIGVRTFNWFVEATPQSNHLEGRFHPAQLPLSLCRSIIARTPGAPILDPFAGSGSVLKAAKMLGRSFIGFELVDTVAEQARVRVSAAQPPLFVAQHEQLTLDRFAEAAS